MKDFISNLKRSGISFYFLYFANIALIPVLTHLITPKELYVWALWFNLSTLIAATGTFKYEFALNITEDDKEAFYIFTSIVTFLIISASLVLMIFFIASKISGNEIIFINALVGSITGFFGGISFSTASWFLRKNEISLHNLFLIVPNILASLSQIICVTFISRNSNNIFYAGSLGYSSLAFLGLISIYYSERSKLLKLDFIFLKKVIFKNRLYLKYTLPFSYAVILREKVIFFILGIYGNATSISFLNLGQKLNGLSNTLLTSPVRPVFLRFTVKNGIVNTKKIIHKIISALILFAIPFWVAGLIWAPILIKYLLGEEWIGLTPYFRLLAIPSFIIATSSWLDRIFDVIKKQKEMFKVEFYFSILMVVCVFVVGFLSKNSLSIVSMMSFIMMIYGWTWLVVIFKLLKIS